MCRGVRRKGSSGVPARKRPRAALYPTTPSHTSSVVSLLPAQPSSVSIRGKIKAIGLQSLLPSVSDAAGEGARNIERSA